MRARQSRLAIDRLAFVLSIGVMLALGCTPEMNAPKLEMEELQGTWHLVYQLMNGTKLPDERAAAMLHGKMVFAGDKIRYTVELPGFDSAFAYKLHPSQQPKAIDLELTDVSDKQGIGKRTVGIYSLEDGTLKICHSETNRPTSFDAGKGSHNVLIVLERKGTEAK